MDDAALRNAFERDGFLVLPGFVTAQACAAMRARMDELLAAFDPAGVRTVFSTRDQAHGRDRYFLESGGEIRFFFEEEAFDAEGALRRPKALAINKVGHALHDLDPVFDRFCRTPDIERLVRALGLREPLLLQSMYIFKQPLIGGEVGCHQDGTFLFTGPESVLGLWFALEDATVENGCLWALPGAQREPLRQRFVRDGASTRMVMLDPRPWSEDGLVPLEAETGALVVLHGRLPHRSMANRSPRSRHAFSLHLIDGACRYPEDNWLRRGPELPARGF